LILASLLPIILKKLQIKTKLKTRQNKINFQDASSVSTDDNLRFSGPEDNQIKTEAETKTEVEKGI